MGEMWGEMGVVSRILRGFGRLLGNADPGRPGERLRI